MDSCVEKKKVFDLLGKKSFIFVMLKKIVCFKMFGEKIVLFGKKQ